MIKLFCYILTLCLLNDFQAEKVKIIKCFFSTGLVQHVGYIVRLKAWALLVEKLNNVVQTKQLSIFFRNI